MSYLYKYHGPGRTVRRVPYIVRFQRSQIRPSRRNRLRRPQLNCKECQHLARRLADSTTTQPVLLVIVLREREQLSCKLKPSHPERHILCYRNHVAHRVRGIDAFNPLDVKGPALDRGRVQTIHCTRPSTHSTS